MNLPHIQNGSPPVPVKKAALGPKSMRAISRPIRVRNRGRQTLIDTGFTGTFRDVDLPLPDPTGSYRTLEVQRKNLLRLPYTSLARMALDLDSQLNKGLWDFVRFGNPGFIVDGTPEASRLAAEQKLEEIGCHYGTIKNHFDSMWSSIFIYGGLFVEAILDRGSRNLVDIAVNDPLTARFRLVQDPVRGQVWQLRQQQRSGSVPMDTTFVRYLGFERLGNNPYGRPMIAPAVHSSLFLLGLIQDLRRVIANQGLSRIDYSLESEQILALLDRNPDIAGDDEATAQFISDQIDAIKEVLENLDVDQDYVHLDTVSVNYATNPVQTNMNGLDTLVETLQRDVINGMKSVSVLSNLLDSTTETHGNLQLEYYVSAIQSVQEEKASVITDFLNMGNQVSGRRSDIQFMYKRQRTADRKQVAETEKVQTETVLSKLAAGVIDVSQAQQEIADMRDNLVLA